MRYSLKRIIEEAAIVAAKTNDRETLSLAELIHDLAEHLQEQEAEKEGEG